MARIQRAEQGGGGTRSGGGGGGGGEVDVCALLDGAEGLCGV